MRIFDWSEGSKKQGDRALQRQRWRRRLLISLASLSVVLVLCGLTMSSHYRHISKARRALQDTANDAALRAAARLVSEGKLGNDPDLIDAITDARSVARTHVRRYSQDPTSSLDSSEAADEDEVEIEVGYLADSRHFDGELETDATSRFNAVTIQVRRDGPSSGGSPLLLASLFGLSGSSLAVEATAEVNGHIRGFESPENEDDGLPILPFALDLKSWQELVDGNAYDDWSWNGQRRVVSGGPDGIREVNLYPQGDGDAASRGTINVGKNYSRSKVAHQILHGIMGADLEDRKGRFAFDTNKRLRVEGEAGINVGVARELELIRGEPRVLPVFRSVEGSDDKATYTIVKFVGVRVVDVKLSGPPRSRRVLVQPAAMVVDEAISTRDPSLSELIFTPAEIVE